MYVDIMYSDCNTLQHTATDCNTLQQCNEYVCRHNVFRGVARVLIHVVCCSVLQRVAVCCSVLQCDAVCCRMVQYIAQGDSTRTS